MYLEIWVVGQRLVPQRGAEEGGLRLPQVAVIFLVLERVLTVHRLACNNDDRPSARRPATGVCGAARHAGGQCQPYILSHTGTSTADRARHKAFAAAMLSTLDIREGNILITY